MSKLAYEPESEDEWSVLAIGDGGVRWFGTLKLEQCPKDPHLRRWRFRSSDDSIDAWLYYSLVNSMMRLTQRHDSQQSLGSVV